MKKAESGTNAVAGNTMGKDAGWHEQLSALADGQLAGDDVAAALAFAEDDEGLQRWQMYHLIGDVLRSPDLAQPASPVFLNRLREELAKESLPQRPAGLAPVDRVVGDVSVPSANASVFRWKIVAGFASLVAVAAIGWTSLAQIQGGGTGGAQLASAQPPAVAQDAPVVAVAEAEGQPVMIRDPRLDELLAAHKQFGSTSALQMPAGFLRNATFESPGR